MDRLIRTDVRLSWTENRPFGTQRLMGIMFWRSFSTLTLLPGSPQLVWQGHLKWFSSTAFQHKFTASHSQSLIALQTYQPSSPCMDKPFCLKSFHAQTISKPFAQGFNQMVSACHLSEGLVDQQTVSSSSSFMLKLFSKLAKGFNQMVSNVTFETVRWT